MAIHREDKDKRYKCGNRYIQDLPTTKVCQHQGPNSQRKPTLPQKPPISLISLLPRHINLQTQPLASIPQKCASPILPLNMTAPPYHPSASIPLKSAPPLPTSDLPAHLPQPSASITQQYMPYLLPSNLPDPLSQLSVSFPQQCMSTIQP